MSDIPGQSFIPGTQPGDGESGRPRPAREARAARTAPLLPGPPACNTGGKLAWTHRAISIDWLRVSFRAGGGHLDRVRKLLGEVFGPSEEAPGLWGYKRGLAFRGGARLSWANVGEEAGTGDSSCCVELQGGPLGTLDPAARVELCKRVAVGGRVTRLDLALDFFHDTYVGLVRAVHEACIAEQLCQFRKWMALVPHDGPDVDGYSVYLGSMKSERYVCVYDKGLETGTRELGQWERVEVRWSGDAADHVGQDVLGAPEFGARAFDLVLGSMSFREKGTGNDGHVNRRELLPWWRDVCDGGVPRAMVPKREKRTLGRFVSWLRESVLPTVCGLGAAVDRGHLEVLEHLVGERPRIRSSPTLGLLLADFRESVQARPFAAPF